MHYLRPVMPDMILPVLHSYKVNMCDIQKLVFLRQTNVDNAHVDLSIHLK